MAPRSYQIQADVGDHVVDLDEEEFKAVVEPYISPPTEHILHDPERLLAVLDSLQGVTAMEAERLFLDTAKGMLHNFDVFFFECIFKVGRFHACSCCCLADGDDQSVAG